VVVVWYGFGAELFEKAGDDDWWITTVTEVF
jgi:hypothetical protein